MAILFSDECFLEHETLDHPESADRLRSIAHHLEATGLARRFSTGIIRTAGLPELERVHDREYIQYVETLSQQGGGRIDSDTIVSTRSYDVARKAAGTALAAVDAVLGGAHDKAVCLCRPPGHHALANRGMGFCLFNNVAIAARHALANHGLSRVLIVDWDVHHGNGTQDIFYESGEVGFLSAHRYPFYPGSGTIEETGSGSGLGSTLNLPVAFGLPRSEYCAQFRAALGRAADRCRPELILLSAGFDAHKDDPIGSLGLESRDFGELTQLVIDAADEYCGGRIVSLLEGGYNVDALAESVAWHLQTLVGDASARKESTSE
jgi:acetoin utilization deacetylase AcuC-like enzyme